MYVAIRVHAFLVADKQHYVKLHRLRLLSLPRTVVSLTHDEDRASAQLRVGGRGVRAVPAPDAVVDEVLGYAGRPLATALEIGAGTGKATRLFAARGIAVTATDPDPAMLAELRRHVPADVTTVRASLEDLPTSRTYDLVLAAASLHWTDPGRRWERIAALLAPGGVVACIAGPTSLADPALEAVVRAASSPEVPDDRAPSPARGTPAADLQWPGGELAGSALFTGVREVVIERRTTVSAADLVGELSTVSAYLVLPLPQRATVLERVLAVLPDRVPIAADLTLHLATSV